MPNRRRTWPYSGEELNRDPPVGWYQAPGLVERSDRRLVGPLRYGTTPGVGPDGRVVIADYTDRSDIGTDRVTPRDYDPMGTCRSRFGDIPSDLIAREVRSRNGR